MFPDILRFYRDARAILDGDTPTGMTLGEYLADRGFGSSFRDHFLVPITAAVWSTAPGRTSEYPVDYLLRFLDNHGLIGVGQSHPWRTVTGGSRTYVDRLLAALPAGQPPVRRSGRRRHSRRGRSGRAHPRRHQ